MSFVLRANCLLRLCSQHAVTSVQRKDKLMPVAMHNPKPRSAPHAEPKLQFSYRNRAMLSYNVSCEDQEFL